jgi:hypothetical protein
LDGGGILAVAAEGGCTEVSGELLQALGFGAAVQNDL